jgi:segregation and condensation protein B
VRKKLLNNNNKEFKTNLGLVEALLFTSKEPIETENIIEFLKIDIREFEQIIDSLEEKYEAPESGIILKKTGGGLQLFTKPEFHDDLKEFYSIRRTSKLTIASLETLAIISYRQPATIAEISRMRNVNSISPVKNLLQKKLIKISGRKKVPGLPALYSTTREFLLYFGLNNLSELPSLEELTEMFEEKELPSLFDQIK